MTDLPSSIPELIAKLDRDYPHKCPRIEESERAIFKYAGKRELVDTLKVWYSRNPKE